MIKAIIASILIIFAIIFTYPMENIILENELSNFTENSSIDKDLIKGFGKVKIENYEKIMDLGQKINESDYKAIYFNEEQANKIEEQINEDNNWT